MMIFSLDFELGGMNLRWNGTSMLLMTGLIYLQNMHCGFLIESCGKRQFMRLSAMMWRKKLVNEMTEKLEMIDLKGEGRVRMILVSHIAGLTDISAKLDCRSYRK